MSAPRQQVSLGSLSLVLCLALPMGVLSLLSPGTTGDQVDAAHAVIVARVTSMQTLGERSLTFVAFDVERTVIGMRRPLGWRTTVRGRPPFDPGDRVLALFSGGLLGSELIGSYRLQHNDVTLEDDVVTPVTGMTAYGISDQGAVPLALVETAIRVRLGLEDPAALDKVPDDDTDVLEGMVGDRFEPNNDLASATPVFLDPPKPITGMPTLLTGLNLTDGDVDFFGFDAPAFALLHVETRLPGGVTGMSPDTFLGFFDAGTGELLAFDDNSGSGKNARITVPIELPGTNAYAVAVESAPDTDLDFTGDEGQTTGDYELLLELENASHISNASDMVVGVSPDGSFIEDLVGFKRVGSLDVLLPGLDADGWGLMYDVAEMGRGALPTTIFGGGGSHLTDPDFNVRLAQEAFRIGAFVDSNGFNRVGLARSETLVPHADGPPAEGLGVIQEYEISLNQHVVVSSLRIIHRSSGRISNVRFVRVLDVDLFGEGADTFHWSFGATDQVKAFPIRATENVGSLAVPARSGVVTGDMQMALLLEQSGPMEILEHNVGHPLAYTLVTGFALADDAVQSAVQNLFVIDLDAWVVAVDQDPDTGFFAAFGAGIHYREH